MNRRGETPDVPGAAGTAGPPDASGGRSQGLTDELPAPLRTAIETRLREHHTQGLALCAFDAHGMVFAGGVGNADLARSEPVTPETIFRAASISKLLTATLALRLVEQGHLDLAAPVNDHLPPELRILDRDGHPATSPVAMLLSHTSGLPSGVRGASPGNAAVSYVANQGRVRNLADAVSGLRLVRAPGERIVYSNPAYNVIGHVAAGIVGLPFEAAVREQVLGPLGMVGAEFTPQRSGAGVATPYGSIVPPAVGGRSAAGLRLVATPMGGLTTSVVELARFGRMVLGGGSIDGQQILGPDVLADATSMHATNHPDLDVGYGLGFKVRTWHGRRVIGHDGNMPGVATQLLIAPEDGVGVAVLTNGYALSVPHEAAALALEHLLGDTSTGPDTSTGTDPEVLDSAQSATAAAFGRTAAGTYRQLDASPPGIVGRLNEAGIRVRVTHEVGGRLRVDGNPGSGGPAWLLPTVAPGRYRVAAGVDDDTSAIIEEHADGMHLWLGHTTHLFRRARRR